MSSGSLSHETVDAIWNNPKLLDKVVLKRLIIFCSYRDKYLNDDYLWNKIGEDKFYVDTQIKDFKNSLTKIISFNENEIYLNQIKA